MRVSSHSMRNKQKLFGVSTIEKPLINNIGNKEMLLNDELARLKTEEKRLFERIYCQHWKNFHCSLFKITWKNKYSDVSKYNLWIHFHLYQFLSLCLSENMNLVDHMGLLAYMRYQNRWSTSDQLRHKFNFYAKIKEV